MNKTLNSELRITEITSSKQDCEVGLPIFLSGVQAGFPSPADDYIEDQLNINELLVQHPAATFFVRVEGESMQDANIHTGDILVVDRSLDATNNKIIIAVINGEFTVKRFITNKSGVFLMPENPKYPSFKIDDDSDFQIWGVVTYIIHKAK